MAKSNKLAILIPYTFYPPTSGGHKAVYAYTRYIAQEWPTICLGVAENEQPDTFEFVPLFHQHIGKYVNPLVALRIRRFLQREGIRFLAFQHHYQALLLRPFLLGLGLKTMVFSHNLEFQRWRSMGKWWWPLMKLSEAYVYRWADAVCFISHLERAAAPSMFGLPAAKCLPAPYPIDLPESPPAKPAIRQQLIEKHGFAATDKLLLFFGPQSYLPNLRAVEDIVYRIHPLLQRQADFSYRILLCGGGLPERYNKFADLASEGVHYLGFVEDIEAYVQACDIVLNPVNIGGGVKTKLVEAIAEGKTVVSSVSGAEGVDYAAYGEKLIRIADTDWPAYASAIIAATQQAQQPTPAAFYAEHYGSNAIREVIRWMEEQLKIEQI